ncbi:unnamed protein product [Parascedosporium putredinis]|uniref:Ribosomal protein L1 n=1 Tax=Parascedosporium putredinis TaxID=1442378 RepID=A0A9P1MBM8_9PEZI|nr:unnamed protein product [Parascedosporium putredinis]CAI7995106.1 unnamed protein product [Parascedosporium putredinis]
MAPSKQIAKTSQVEAQIDPDQTLKASKALLAHIKKASEEQTKTTGKKNILDEIEEDGSLTLAETPIWLTLTTKRHIVDTNRLKPAKISLPHSLHTNVHESICIITADPQRAYKNIVASDEFPAELRARIGRVIGYSKLRAKYRQYEAQRQLFGEHDIFLGDDRIINRLPQALGKTFYKTTAKRPIPIVLQKSRPKAKAKKTPKQKDDEDAISSALVALTPSTNTSIKVGYASWKPEQLAENIQAVASALVENHVPKKWNNVKSIYVKGSETTALPIWQTEELWVDGKDVIADADAKALEGPEKANVGKKRKTIEGVKEGKKGPLSKKQKVPESNDDTLKKQIAETKTRLRKQKDKAKAALD